MTHYNFKPEDGYGSRFITCIVDCLSKSWEVGRQGGRGEKLKGHKKRGRNTDTPGSQIMGE